MLYVIFFFFSSRRRHTRCSRDWSSDVCSSDLFGHPVKPFVPGETRDFGFRLTAAPEVQQKANPDLTVTSIVFTQSSAPLPKPAAPSPSPGASPAASGSAAAAPAAAAGH